MAITTARKHITFIKHATDAGQFYTSDATPLQLVMHIRGLAKGPGIKWASIGGEQEQGFEQSFSSLGYAYLKDKAPRLIDYIVGFQLVDRNDDNTKAVGVFGFKIGKQWLYAPIFFLNGDLKGHELLYIKNQDSFVPMKENWVNYILSRKPHVLGEGSAKDTWQLGGIAPNIERLSYPPPHNKYGSALERLQAKAAAAREGRSAESPLPDYIRVGNRDVAGWAVPALPLLAAIATKQANFLWPNAPADRKVDVSKLPASPVKAALADVPLSLEDFLATDVSLLEGAYNISQRYPGIKVAFDKFYGSDFFHRVGLRIKQAAEEAANCLIKGAEWETRIAPNKPRSELDFSLLKEAQPPEDDKKPKVKILTDPDVSLTVNKELPEKDKEKLLHHGYLVKDERKGDEISHAYNTQVRTELTNPHETGIYEVLEKPGEFGRMLVVQAPSANDGQKNFCTVVRLGDGEKSWLNGHRTSLWTKTIESENDFREWFKGLGNSETLSKGGTYLAINQAGEGTVPFVVSKVYEDKRYKVDFKGYEDWKAGRASGLPKVTEPSSYSGDGGYVSNYDALLVINDRPGTKLRAAAGTLHVPDTFKFMKLKDPPKPKKDDGDGPSKSSIGGPVGWDSDGSDPKPIVPGDIGDIQLLFTTKTASMKMWGDHSEVSIQTIKRGCERMPWRHGLFCLIRDHGLGESEAAAMLKQAQVHSNGMSGSPVQYRVVYAKSYPREKTAGYYPSGDLQSGGPYAPVMPAPEYGSEQVGYNSVNAIYPQSEHVPVSGLDSSQTDPRIYDPFLMPDQKAVQTAQQAGQEGQKEVFDTSMISGMLKSVRQDSLVDRHLPDLMKAVDKLGRLLFLFYWHQDDFKERYGKNSLPEMEDSLRNAFESLADIVLFLKEKTIEPRLDEIQDPDMEESGD